MVDQRNLESGRPQEGSNMCYHLKSKGVLSLQNFLEKDNKGTNQVFISQGQSAQGGDRNGWKIGGRQNR